MRMPWDCGRSRLLWSIPALVIICLWQYGILAASTVPFIKACTPSEVFRYVLEAQPEDYWPGEYGLCSSPIPRTIQIAPLIAAAAWALCLVQWSNRARRVIVLSAALLPAWGVILQPFSLVLWPHMLCRSLFFPIDGEDLEEKGIWISAAGMWWWLIVPLIICAWRARKSDEGRCATCEYSLIGLPGAVCPECGSVVPATSRSRSRAIDGVRV